MKDIIVEIETKQKIESLQALIIMEFKFHYFETIHRKVSRIPFPCQLQLICKDCQMRVV